MKLVGVEAVVGFGRLLGIGFVGVASGRGKEGGLWQWVLMVEGVAVGSID